MLDFFNALRTTIQQGEYALEQMEDRIDLVGREDLLHQFEITDVSLIGCKCGVFELALYQIDIDDVMSLGNKITRKYLYQN